MYHNFVAITTDLCFFVKYAIIYRLKSEKRGGFMFKGAVFDMDGLMIDSERLVYSIWQEMLDEDGKEFNLDIFKKTIGLRSEDSYEYYSRFTAMILTILLTRQSRESAILSVSKRTVCL